MLTNFDVLIDREMFLSWQLHSIVKSGKHRAIKAWSPSKGEMRFLQTEKGMLFVHCQGWGKDDERIWINFAEGTHPMTEDDVAEFVQYLYPETANETVVI